MKGQRSHPHMMLIFYLFILSSSSVDDSSLVIFQNTQLNVTSDLFYTSVSLGDTLELQAMLESSSMACSLSFRLLPWLEEANVVFPDAISPTSVVLVGCWLVGFKSECLSVTS